MRTRDHLLVLCSVVMLLLFAATPASASAITPGLTLDRATVTGPGLAKPRVLSDTDGTNVAKAWVATSTFGHSAQPPKDATIYTIHLTLDYATTGLRNTELLFAWDGQHGWFTGGTALDKAEYFPAPGAVIAALEPVISEAKSAQTSTGSTSSPSNDDGNGTILIVVVGLVVVALLAAGFVLVRRRKTPQSTARA
jgi:LPXTG-motif cell wall-anchored protein